MKKRFLLLALLLSVSLCGCKKSEPEVAESTETVSEEASVEDTETESEPESEEVKEPSVAFEEIKNEFKNDTGKVLLEMTGKFPAVSLPDKEEAEAAINAFLDEQREAYADTVEEYKGIAESDFTERKESGEAEDVLPFPYGIGREYAVLRLDDKMISFVEDDYFFTGGAHPNSSRIALNFDGTTGKQLMFTDITNNQEQTMQQVLEAVREQCEQEEYKDMLLDDYEKDLQDILTDYTWYLKDDGFHVICNEDTIAPHAAGILEFTVPYEILTDLKPEYLPN